MIEGMYYITSGWWIFKSALSRSQNFWYDSDIYWKRNCAFDKEEQALLRWNEYKESMSPSKNKVIREL